MADVHRFTPSCHLPPACSIAPVKPASEFGCTGREREWSSLSSLEARTRCCFLPALLCLASQGRGGCTGPTAEPRGSECSQAHALRVLESDL